MSNIRPNKMKKHSESANLRQAAVLNFVESHIFHAKIISVGLPNLVKISQIKAKLLQVEDFRYGGFDLKFWPVSYEKLMAKLDTYSANLSYSR